MAKNKDKPRIDVTDEWVDELIANVGGVDNVLSLAHCLTRLRFVLKDETKFNANAISDMKYVKGTFKSAGQHQVIIGSDIEIFFNKIIEHTGLKSVSKSELKETAVREKGNKFVVVMNFLGEIFIPIIPVLVAGGIILGIRNIFEADFNGWVMTEKSQFMNGLDAFLWIPGQVCLWWLPVHICWSIFKKMGADEVLGIVIGLCLLVAPLVNVYEAMGKADGSTWIWDIVNNDPDDMAFDFGFMKYPWKIQYTAQVIPAFAVGIIGAYINRWIKRVSPGYITQISVPIVTILPTYIIAMFAVGPLGFIIGSVIGFGFKWALTNSIAKYFFGFIIGTFYAPIVITGVHHLFNAIFVQETASNGGSFLFVGTCAQAIAQGSAVVGWMIMNKKDPKVKDIGAPAIVSAYLGVTEPAMYGINIKYMYPFVGACLASGVGLEIGVISGVTTTNSGNGAWLGILNVQVHSLVPGVTTWFGTGYAWFMIAMCATAVSSAIFTILLSRVSYFKKFNIEIKAAEQFVTK